MEKYHMNIITVVVTFVPGPGNKSFEIGTSFSSAGKSVVSISTISVLYGETFRECVLVFVFEFKFVFE